MCTNNRAEKRDRLLEELEAMRAKKADERGGFAEKKYLEYVEIL